MPNIVLDTASHDADGVETKDTGKEYNTTSIVDLTKDNQYHL